MHKDMHTNMPTGVHKDMHTNMTAGMHTDVHTDMPTDMHTDICPATVVKASSRNGSNTLPDMAISPVDMPQNSTRIGKKIF